MQHTSCGSSVSIRWMGVNHIQRAFFLGMFSRNIPVTSHNSSFCLDGCVLESLLGVWDTRGAVFPSQCPHPLSKPLSHFNTVTSCPITLLFHRVHSPQLNAGWLFLVPGPGNDPIRVLVDFSTNTGLGGIIHGVSSLSGSGCQLIGLRVGGAKWRRTATVVASWEGRDIINARIALDMALTDGVQP